MLAACTFREGRLGTSASTDAQADSVDTLIDASDDAPPDADLCTGYDLTLATSTTRYRVITTAAVFRTHMDTCAADAPGHTHLVALDTVAEIVELRDALAAFTGAPYFIGAAQVPAAAGTADWYVFTGGALPAGQWGPGQPSETGTTSNEQIANIAADLLHDATGGTPSGAVCECDHLGVDSTVLGYVP